MNGNPFAPTGATLTLSATTTSGTTSRTAIVPSAQAQQLRLAAPAGGAVVFVKVGNSAVTAAVTDMPLLPGTIEMFSIGPQDTHIAAITAASTQSVYVTPGQGI